ncbi:MAG: hypothetical protein ACP5M5_10125 [Acidibrevibacterium sp.]|uniref:hypothetical protein n=1 Tax=Acidibrevibacterium sp. TaxID=2606776 RepID=UPI003D022A2C
MQNIVNNQLVDEILFPNTSAANWSYVYIPFANGVPQSATYYSSSGGIVGNPTDGVSSLPPPTQPVFTTGISTSGGGSSAAGAAGSVVPDAAAWGGAVAGAIGSLLSDGASAVGNVVNVVFSFLGTVRSAPNPQNVVAQSNLAAGLAEAAAAADAGWTNMEQNLAAAKGQATAPLPSKARNGPFPSSPGVSLTVREARPPRSAAMGKRNTKRRSSKR